MGTEQGGISRGWLLTLGVILIIIGCVSIGLPLLATLAVTLLVGWILLISGVIQVVHSFSSAGWGRVVLRLLAGLLYVAAGIMVLVYPLGGALTLTLLLAILFILEGVIKIIASLQNRAMPNWGWLFVSGLLALVIGGLVWRQWPSSAVWAIGLLVGINVLFRGWSLVMIASAARE